MISIDRVDHQRPPSLAVPLTVPRDRMNIGSMPKTLSEVAQDAAELSASDRLKLARLMLDVTDWDPGSGSAEAEWGEEIEKRLEELRRGEVAAVPWEEVRKRIEAGFKS